MNSEQKRAHDYLKSYCCRRRMLHAAADEYARAVSTAEHITAAVGDSGPSPSPSASKMTDAADSMLECADRAAAESDGMAALLAERDAVISAVADRNPLCGEILEMYYKEELPVAKIRIYLAADRCHPYARSSVYRLLDRARTMAFQAMRDMGVR